MANPNIVLNLKQQELYDLVVRYKKNVFFTGCGGTGKSFIIKKIVEDLRIMHPNLNKIAVTASTGRAAFNIKGTTLHSFAGIGLATESIDVLTAKVLRNSKAAQRWQNAQVLIIDEISMISGELFTKVESLARSIRKSNRPFGGIQLVLVGDLLQLPPVNTNSKVQRVFQSTSWNSCITNYVRLDTVFRQSDPEFIKALCCIRVGAITDQVLEFMKIITKPKNYPDELEPVNLYSRKDKTDNFNNARLLALEGDSKVFKAKDKVVQRTGGSSALSSCPASANISLRVGAQVMLVKNLSKELVNGTVGVVTGFTKQQVLAATTIGTNSSLCLPIVRFTMANNRMYTKPIEPQTWETLLPNGTIQCSRTQLPLILSWAITIHKAQGQTIQRLRVDLDGIFESGQVYTALSRAVSADTLEVLNFSPSSIKVDQESLNFCLENDLI